jgi:hypothetical protein
MFVFGSFSGDAINIISDVFGRCQPPNICALIEQRHINLRHLRLTI